MALGPSRIRLLFVTRTSPFAGESGAGEYVFSLLRHLAGRDFEIRVIWTEPPDLNSTGGWYAPPSESRTVCSLEIAGAVRVGPWFWQPAIVWLPLKARASHAIKIALQALGLWRRPPRRPASPSPAAVSGSPASSRPRWGDNATAVEIAVVRRAIARWRPDVVLANYSWMAGTVRPFASRTPRFAVLTLDVRQRQVHLRDGRTVEVFGEFCTPAEEYAQLALADALVAIQSIEAAFFKKLFPAKTVVTSPMPVFSRSLPPSADPVVLFVGSGHAPNIAGLNWFLAHVWPLVRSELPTSRLLIAGTICAALEFETLPIGLELLGRLPDLAVAYSRATMVIAPLLQGSGVKIKVLEAVGYGRVCLTTSVGLEGLEKLLPALRVADTPEAFARETIALLRAPSEAAAAGEAVLALARTHLSSEACYRPVVDLLRALVAAPA